MAYLPQFKNDLFISYRRASNEGADAWVDTFCKQVRSSLKDLVGDVSVWRDTAELRAGELWRPEIAEAVDSSGVFLALISRTYFDSDECRKEFDRFLGKLKGKDADGRKLVPVLKHPPRPDSVPPELAQIGHHQFFDLDPKPFRELDPRRQADADAYRERLERLVLDLMVALETLHGQQKKQARGKVFIASVGPELLQERERLRTDLQQRGWLVVPEREYLWNADDHRQRIAADLADAEVCVHLVQRTESLEPLTPARTRLQLELALEDTKKRGRPAPVVWIQPAETTDPQAAALIDAIETTFANDGVDYVEGSLEDFKTLVVDRLPKPPPAATPATVKQVALLVEEGDLDDIGPLKTLLADTLGVEPRPLKFKGSVPRDDERLARTLAACPLAVVYWGKQDEDWVFDMMDLPALANRLGPDKLCIYAGGDASGEKQDFSTRKATMVRGMVQRGTDELRAFLGGTGGRVD